MKKFYSIVAVSMLSVGVFAQTVEVNETFGFTGALSSNGWATHSGTVGQLQTAGGVAVLVAGATEDVNKALATPYAITAGAVNQVSYSATVNVLNSTGLAAAGDYFLSLGSTAGASVTVLPARLYVKPGTSGYLLGVLNTSGGTVAPTFSTTEIPYGTPANVTVNYIVETGATTTQTATLQIDAQSLLTNTTGTGAAPANVASVTLRQGGTAAAGTGNVTVDNLVVTSYAKITLAVDTITALKANFVQNTIVNDAIKFGLKSDVKVYNMNGQVVKSAAVEKGSTLNVSSLPKGIYIVTGNVGGQVVSQKITKN